MAIKINPENLTEQGKENFRKWLEEGFFGKTKTQVELGNALTQEPEQESEPEIKNSIELSAGLPDYAYKVDKNFKYETRDSRNQEMMKKIDEAVLKMREDGILKTESKNGGVYTTINFPNEKPIHFLEPDLTKYSDEGYKSSYDYPFGGKENIHKDEVTLGGMRGDVDEWKNEKLKQYIKNSGLALPKQSSIEEFMKKLADFVNLKYSLNISDQKESMDLFCRAMNSIGVFWLADYQDSSRSYFLCYANGHLCSIPMLVIIISRRFSGQITCSRYHTGLIASERRDVGGGCFRGFLTTFEMR